jgi:hypothetical protein
VARRPRQGAAPPRARGRPPAEIPRRVRFARNPSFLPGRNNEKEIFIEFCLRA